jgi:hypothetical protein
MILREGKTPGGREVRTVIKHLTRRIRRHFPKTRITWRGDSHYGRPEAIAWCEDNAAGFIFGLAGNIALDRLCQEAADDLCVRRAEACAETMRAFASFPLSGQELGQAAQGRRAHGGHGTGARHPVRGHLAAWPRTGSL